MTTGLFLDGSFLAPWDRKYFGDLTADALAKISRVRHLLANAETIYSQVAELLAELTPDLPSVRGPHEALKWLKCWAWTASG